MDVNNIAVCIPDNHNHVHKQFLHATFTDKFQLTMNLHVTGMY